MFASLAVPALLLAPFAAIQIADAEPVEMLAYRMETFAEFGQAAVISPRAQQQLKNSGIMQGPLPSTASATGSIKRAGVVSRILERMMQRRKAAGLPPAPETPPVPVFTGPSHQEIMRNVTGVFLTSGSAGRAQFLDDTMRDVKAAGGNAIIIDVKGSRVYFSTDASLANQYELVQPMYDLPAIIEKAHAEGLYVMGRLIAVKDDGITSRAPETLVRHPVSNAVLSYGWIDPSNELALQYNREVICSLAKMGIDEINLDYIRFSTANFGALKVWTGQEKAEKVRKFVEMTRATIDECGPKTLFGMSSYAILGWNYPVNLETLGQDIVAFAPMVDIISPMAYPATFTSPEYYVPGRNPGSRMYWLVYRTMTGYQELLGPEHSKKIRPWIQGYGVTTQNMKDQMQALTDAGVCGFQVWSAGNNYAPTYAAMPSFRRPENCAAM